VVGRNGYICETFELHYSDSGTMRKPILLLLFALWLAASVHADSGPGSGHDDSDILLKLKNGKNIETILNRYPALDPDKVEGFSIPNTYKVEVEAAGDLDTTITAMKSDPDIVWVSFNFFGETPEGVRRTLAVTDSTPSESEYHDQTAVLRMHLSEAQVISKGKGVIVAVIDTGVDYNHPDLADHMLKDGGGDIIGKDFVDNDNDPMDEANGIDDDGDCPNENCIDEGWGHGTHVAGIIALVAPEAKILPIRALNSDGVGTSDALARAIDFALDFTKHDGKVVINLSLGIPEFSPLINEELLEAREEGVPVIASAGNNNNETMHYPATEPAEKLVISVPGTNPDDVKAGFSNFNSLFDVAAPSVGIYSTYPNGQFATSDGTSMAAPWVSGEVALLKFFEDPDKPMAQEKIEQIVESGVDNIDAINPNFVGKIGSGRANFFKALQLMGTGELAIKKAVYKSRKAKLVVRVRSSKAPDAVLTVSDQQTQLGIMEYSPIKNAYTLKLKGISSPNGIVTISSSAGGTIGVVVKIKN
jgi:thermitase